MANEDVAWGYELENYINIGTPEAPKWVKATELLSWEQSGESKKIGRASCRERVCQYV